MFLMFKMVLIDWYKGESQLEMSKNSYDKKGEGLARYKRKNSELIAIDLK